jgi:hypothetical protein
MESDGLLAASSSIASCTGLVAVVTYHAGRIGVGNVEVGRFDESHCLDKLVPLARLVGQQPALHGWTFAVVVLPRFLWSAS